MKPLIPSHRENKRYLLITGKDAEKKTIEEVLLEFVGVLGYSEINPKVIKSFPGKIILSINRETLDKTRTSFFLSGKNLDIKKVSGNLKKLL
jgi:hypothetical protein